MAKIEDTNINKLDYGNIINSLNNSNFNSSLELNTRTYNDYLFRLLEIALTRFEWINLPDSCDARCLELWLHTEGKAAFCFDEKLGYLTLHAAPSGEINMYLNPVKIKVWSLGYDKTYDNEDCIYIRNNYLVLPTTLTLTLFANRLYEATRTIDINVGNQKTPYILKTDSKQQLTLKNILAKLKGNEQDIIVDKNFNMEDINQNKIDLQVPFIADKITEYKHEIWNEAMTFLGINNSNTQKKERLITNEVESNNEMIDLNGSIMLECRKKACKEINKKYGLNIDVQFRNSEKENTSKNEEGKI